MELERPSNPSNVSALASYCRGAWFVHNKDGQIIRVTRHMARVRLMRRLGCTRPTAEQKLNEIIEWAISHPDQALEIKRRAS